MSDLHSFLQWADDRVSGALSRGFIVPQGPVAALTRHVAGAREVQRRKYERHGYFAGRRNRNWDRAEAKRAIIRGEDPMDIAARLECSATTIYNLRTDMRNAGEVPREPRRCAWRGKKLREVITESHAAAMERSAA